MTLKSACKTAITLTILSLVLILAGRVINFISFFVRTSSEHNGWAFGVGDQGLAGILMHLLISFMPLLYPGLLLAGFIPLLSGHLKQQNDPQSNVKKRFIIAAILIALAALLMAWRTVGYTWIILRHQPYLSFQSGLSLCWHLIATLCALSLCIFIVAYIRKRATRTPAILTLICHWLLVTVTIAGTANTLCHVLTTNSTRHFGPLFSILWFMSSALFYSGTFLWLAAVLLFLFAYLKNLPPQAGVIESSPEPMPTLTAEQLRPEQG